MFSTRRSTAGAGYVEQHSSLKYPYRLNFYDIPPQEDVALEEFESSAIDRIRVLAEIESSLVRNRPYEEVKATALAQCNKYLPLDSTSAHAQDVDSQRKKDHLGHFVLRLAFCRSDELRRRFVKTETALFKIRYETDDTTERETFLKSKKFAWELVSKEEFQQFEKELKAVSPPEKHQSDNTFYKVDWTRVPDLVATRRVFVKRGKAYVAAKDQLSIVLQDFQEKLEHALEATAKALPRLDEDDRILPILAHLSQGFLAGIPSEFSSSNAENGEEVTAEMIDDLAKKHFPMCMRNLHDNLRKDRHLKHYGRLQYGLFLKALGLSIDQAITFWRKAFSGITDDKFQKEYKYNIRHSYGLEGKRTNYPALNCQRILTNNQPGPTESHGCPFRHFSEDSLRTALGATYNLSPPDLTEIMKLVEGKHYHVACTRVFEATHQLKRGEGLGGGESVNHPNGYVKRSRELEKERMQRMDVDGPPANS